MICFLKEGQMQEVNCSLPNLACMLSSFLVLYLVSKKLPRCFVFFLPCHEDRSSTVQKKQKGWLEKKVRIPENHNFCIWWDTVVPKRTPHLTLREFQWKRSKGEMWWEKWLKTYDSWWVNIWEMPNIFRWRPHRDCYGRWLK